MQQLHVYFLHPAPTLAMVAVRAGSHNVCPNVLTAQMSWGYMIHSQIPLTLPTILASIIVPAKHLAASQLDVRTRPMNLVFQPDHRRTWQQLFHRSNLPAPIYDHICFARQD
jgi:hypothetical protein